MGRQGSKGKPVTQPAGCAGQSMATLAWTQHRMLAKRIDPVCQEAEQGAVSLPQSVSAQLLWT